MARRTCVRGKRTGTRRQRTYTPEIQPRYIRAARRMLRDSADGKSTVEPQMTSLNAKVGKLFDFPAIKSRRVKMLTDIEAQDWRIVWMTRAITQAFGVPPGICREFAGEALCRSDATIVFKGREVSDLLERMEATEAEIDAGRAALKGESVRGYFYTCYTPLTPDSHIHINRATVPYAVCWGTILRCWFPYAMRRQPEVRMNRALMRARRQIDRWRRPPGED